jgi:hypothetical protein
MSVNASRCNSVSSIVAVGNAAAREQEDTIFRFSVAAS